MRTIGIVGYGYVGRAFARMFDDQAGRYEVQIHDPYVKWDQEKLPSHQHGNATREAINKCDMAVVCVPTPSTDDGGCDTSIVESCVDWLETPVILIKSTIKPGTTDQLVEKYKGEKLVVFSPEYVGEGKYHVTPRMDFQTNMKACPFVILGGTDEASNKVLDLLIPLLGPEKDYFKCTAKEAEVIKYMENTYFAVKITFAQEMYDICKAMGVDWHRVRSGWGKDPRVDVMHTAVFPDARGFSGKCLPKDTNALVKSSIEAGYSPSFLIEMLKSNHRFNPSEPVRVKLND